MGPRKGWKARAVVSNIRKFVVVPESARSFFGVFPTRTPIESKNIFIARSWAKRGVEGGGGGEEGEERRRIRLVSIDRELEIGGRMIIKRLILFTFALSFSPLQEEGRGNRSVSEISIKRRTETSWK